MKRKENKCDYDMYNTTPVTQAFVDWQLDHDKQLLDFGVGLDLKQRYMNWLDDKIKVGRIGYYYHFVVPFFNTEHEPLHVYVRKDGYKILLTDDCKTIRGLKARGFHFSAKRKRHIEYALKMCNVSIDKDALVSTSSVGNFAQHIHQFVQAMLLVDGLFTVELAGAKRV